MDNGEKHLKRYYSISEVARMVGVTEPTLRYWETEFQSLRPRTTGNNARRYTDKDIEQIRSIYNLVKVRGFKIAAAKKLFYVSRSSVDRNTKLIEQLTSVRNQLIELKKALESMP